MNKVILIGRLTRKPDVKYSNSNICVARYTIAIDRPTKKGEEKKSDFIQCVAIGSNGEFAAKYLTQGIKIIAEGRWQTGSYTNKDGRKIYTNECYVERHEFAESKAVSQQNQNTQPVPEPTPSDYDGWTNIPDGLDESLPFN